MTDTYAEDLIARKIVHEVHTSERRSFRGCRRRWDWVRQGYYPVTTARPLEFGTAFHIAMETLFNPTTWKFQHTALGALAEKAFVETCNEQRKQYLWARDEYALEGEEADDYDERVELGRGMIRYFVKRQLPILQDRYVPTHVEVSFDVPLLLANRHILCRCSACRQSFAKAGGGRWKGNPVVFSGRVDAIVHDMQGGYWIVDWKTASALRDIEIYLELDDQVAGYCYALRRAMGLNIRGFIYFEIRKAFPLPPPENKVVRLGRRYSVNKSMATDYETYLETVSNQDKEAYEEGLYDTFLDWLKNEGIIYYRSSTIYKSDYELAQVEENLVAEVLTMLDPNLRIYPMPGQFSCRTCAYQTPCLSQNAGQDYQYSLDTLYAKLEPYYKRQKKPTTDKVGD